MKTNDNEKTMTMEENGEDLAPLVLDQRLKQEINILKLEGSLFCFDPKEAKRRRGKLTLSDARKLPVTVDINPNYGQPSVLAYKVLQAIFLKVAETGCSLEEDGRCLYNDTVSFSARELALITGRSWGGRTSRQLFDAIMQLRRTGITASLYDKGTDRWEVADLQVLNSAYFAGHGDTISRCAVTLAPEIMESVNRRHVATFNFTRLRSLDTIGLVLYKRIFFHFSNLMHESRRKGSLRLTKDYEAICREWLGG
jgi:Replication initiator protein A